MEFLLQVIRYFTVSQVGKPIIVSNCGVLQPDLAENVFKVDDLTWTRPVVKNTQTAYYELLTNQQVCFVKFSWISQLIRHAGHTTILCHKIQNQGSNYSSSKLDLFTQRQVETVIKKIKTEVWGVFVQKKNM